GPVVIANKDLALSMETAKRLGVMLPVGALYQQLLLKAHYNGWDREDATAVMKIYEEMAGLVRKQKRIIPKMKKN
ncbi:MAG TPA: NAD-binding protein, partial [Desulfatiglandales bacterium]|nr:NAD-binding protein [Desulfatiglandales bacterium]